MSEPLSEITIEFRASLSVELSESFNYEEVLSFAKEDYFDYDEAECFDDLTPEDQLAVLRIWLQYKMTPGVRHRDYSGKNPMICVIDTPPGIDWHSFEVYEIDLDDQPEFGALEVSS
ncbi:hypothetical protein U2F10_03170 [Leptothoe sp. EHU-05/26/07-4]